MTQLETALKAATAAEAHFENTLRAKYPRADRWTWYRAEEAVKNGTADKWDAAMAGDTEIAAAHDAWMADLHAFYALRDGPNGFLGGRAA
jgi:hypothetical protein